MADNSWFEGANSPGAGDLGQMRALQSNLASVAEAARTARTDLNGMKNHVSDAIWRAEAAEEFKNSIDSDFLGQLDQLDESYQDAADGFSSYLTAVSDLKDRAGTLASRIYSAQSSYESAAASLQGWLSSHPDTGSYVSGTSTAPAYGEGSPYTVAFHAAPAKDGAAASTDDGGQAAHATLQSNVDDAWGALQSLYRQMHELKTHDRVAADNAVIGKLEQAHNAGIKNESGWHKFWHAVAEVGKWAGIAIAAVAVVAVLVMAFPEDLGLLLAASVVTDTSFAIGAAVVYGAAAASALAVAGGVGQRFSGDGSGPSWASIGISAFGMIPGLGKAGEYIGKLGAPAAAAVKGLSGMADTVRLRAAYLAEAVTQSHLSKLGELASNWVVTLGANVPVMTVPGVAIWGAIKGNSVRKGAHDLGAGKAIDNAAHAVSGPSDATVRSMITSLRATDPSAAADAEHIAQNLSGDHPNYSYPRAMRYPQALAATP